MVPCYSVLVLCGDLRLFLILTPLSSSETEQRIAPTPPGTVLLGSAALVPPLLATAEGTVLEIGPGSGVQVQYFAAAKAAKRIYGAEPCLPLHKALLSSAREAGLAEKYSIVTAGAEKETLIPGLANAGLLAKHQDGGVFDTIVCVRVLCSVQGLDETCETLYKLLKPGGKILVVEHCVNPWQDPKGSYVARLLQTFYSLLGWSFFVGNCHLTRDIKRALIEAAAMHGGWERDDLENYFGWAALPYVSGTLVKRRK